MRKYLRGMLMVFVLQASVSFCHAATKTWTGSGSDGLWSTPANWNNQELPAASDDVIFDNALLEGDYTVTISGNDSILVNSILITPASGTHITILIDSSSKRQIALTAFREMYSVIINSGGALINNSSTSDGVVISLADSLQITNGGRYVHGTRRPHAALVAKLSRVPGTEHGTFEFDLPSGTGTLSLSNRVYGNMVLSATRAGGTRTYSGTGTNTLTINGDLTLNSGTTFSIDLSGSNGNVIVKGDLIQDASTLNLATGMGNATIFSVAGNIIQDATSQITETNTGFPTLLLNGDVPQHISMAGNIINSVALAVDNPAGVVLDQPLRLPYMLMLKRGPIRTSDGNLLTLLEGCGLQTDSTDVQRFIDGPIRKEGLNADDHFLFPTGKAGNLCWIELKNATGNFVIEYFRGDPHHFSSVYGPGVDHISTEDYWTISADPTPAASASTELSFFGGSSGLVTDMQTLTVAGLSGTAWSDERNAGTTGSAGASGTVSSQVINFTGSAISYFTLASSVPAQNPLPIRLVSFSGSQRTNEISLDWSVDLPTDSTYFVVMRSEDGATFISVADLPAQKYTNAYHYDIIPGNASITSFYKLKVVDGHGDWFYSKTVSFTNEAESFSIRLSSGSMVTNTLGIDLSSPFASNIHLNVIGIGGQVYKSFEFNVRAGQNYEQFNLSALASGLYFLEAESRQGRANTLRFLKL